MIIEVTRDQLDWITTIAPFWIGRASHAADPLRDRFAIGSSKEAVETWAKQAARELETIGKQL
jgi:hypothetical protein